MIQLLLVLIAICTGGQIEYANAFRPIQYQGLTGQGICVGVGDNTAPIWTHPDFDGVKHWQVHEFSDSAQHGSTVAGVIAGRSSDGRYIGFAPNASLVWDYQYKLRVNTGAHFKQYGMSIAVHPYKSDFYYKYPDTYYTSGARSVDDISCEYDSVLHIVSAGNLPSKAYTGMQQGKNVLTVGSINYDWKRYEGGSPKIPAHNGRWYVDIVALGVDIGGIVSLNKYANGTGTSYAAPAVAGCAALLSEAMGGAQPNALLRAILCNTARDIEDVGVDWDSGFGAVDLNAAVHTKDSWVCDTAASCCDVMRYTVVLPQNQSARIALCWNDRGADTLQTDLDLTANGYLPNVMWAYPNENPTRRQRGTDHTNTIEQVAVGRSDTIDIEVSVTEMIEPTQFFLHVNRVCEIYKR